jgi:fructose-1,6-bisphosphatase/inositol monophosphatase family enzyme
MDLLRFCLDMRCALYQCGQVARALQGRVEREDKEPDSIHQMSTSVSVVDRLCQEILLLRAIELAPGLMLHSEEFEELPDSLRDLLGPSDARYALIVDPVDGTSDYLEGKSTYAHMLGILDRETGRMGCGMIYFPETARLLLTVRQVGAFSATGFWGTPRPMTRPQPDQLPRTVEDVKRLQPTDYQVFARLGFGVVPPESASAAHELTRVAEGELGAMAMRHFHGHDTAISSVILEELGGAVLDEHGKPVTYTLEMPRTPLIVSSLSSAYAQELLEALSAS